MKLAVVILQGLVGESSPRERAAGPGVSADPDEGWTLPETFLHSGRCQVSLRGTCHWHLVSVLSGL